MAVEPGPDGCCHKTRLLKAGCPIGWKCPYDAPKPSTKRIHVSYPAMVREADGLRVVAAEFYREEALAALAAAGVPEGDEVEFATILHRRFAGGLDGPAFEWSADCPYDNPTPKEDAVLTTVKLTGIVDEVHNEVFSAVAQWPGMHSAHEGYAVLLEEMDELKAHVWTNQKRRDLEAMRKEAIQVAAMAVRFVLDISDGGRGRV